MTRVRIVVEHAGETFEYEADQQATQSTTGADLGPLLDSAVAIVKRAIGADA